MSSLHLDTIPHYVKSPFRMLGCATKPFKQSQENRRAWPLSTKSDLESQLVFLVCHSVAARLTIYITFFRLWANFNLTEKAFILGISFWFFCRYCLDTCLCACKRLSLDDHYFIWIFKLKVGKKVRIAVQLTELEISLKLQKQGKNY